jgi:hypothetical protein
MLPNQLCTACVSMSLPSLAARPFGAILPVPDVRDVDRTPLP